MTTPSTADISTLSLHDALPILVLAPASLTWQWQLELREKFGIPAVRQRGLHDWEGSPVLVASLDTAKRPPHRDAVLRLGCDMLVEDEAHGLNNARPGHWRLGTAARR